MTKRSAERIEFLADVLTTAVEGGINYNQGFVSGDHYRTDGEALVAFEEFVRCYSLDCGDDSE